MSDNRIISSQEQNEAINFWRNILQINTCIPAIVQQFDSATQRVAAKPAIRAKYINPDNMKVEYIDYPVISNIPLACAWSPKYGGLTYPIAEGDVCTLLFSQRSLDNFLLVGDVSNPFDPDSGQYTEIRCFDLTDAMCFMGVLTNNNVIGEYNQEAVELRNVNGKSKITLTDNSLKLACGSCNIELSDNGIAINGTQLNVTAQTDINGVLTNNSITVTGHTHISSKPGDPTGPMQ